MFEDFPDFKLYLMSGTGNSFAITNFMAQEKINSLPSLFGVNTLNEMAKHICKLTKVDGFIVITEADEKANDYKWVFHNADGSPAEMCGNAARCVGHLCFKNHLAGQEHNFETSAGVINIFVQSENEVHVKMPSIKNETFEQSIEYGSESLNYSYLNTGVPHSVFKINKFEEYRSLTELAAKVRKQQLHHPDGSNVTFYSPTKDNSIQSVSYERGVEGFTEACGTGAVAAAHCYAHEHKDQKVKVQMPGGAVTVDFSGDTPYLIGPISYKSTLFTEDIEELWTNSFTD